MAFSYRENSDGSLDIRIDSQTIPAFKQLVQRGANLWPDAAPEIKTLADFVTNGRVLQDYYSQNQDQRPKDNLHDSATTRDKTL